MPRASARDSASNWLASCEVRRVALRSFCTCSAGSSSVAWVLACWAQAPPAPAAGQRRAQLVRGVRHEAPLALGLALTMPNRRFSESTSGRTSAGEAVSSMALRSRGERRSTASFSASSGFSARSTAQPIAKAAAAISTRFGSSTLNRMELAHCWRGSAPSATTIPTSPSTVAWRCRTMRQVAPPCSSLCSSGSEPEGGRPPSQLSPSSSLPSASTKAKAVKPLPSFRNSSTAGASSTSGRIALADHRVGDQGHQGQQALVLLAGHVAGGAVVEPGVQDRQQDQRRDQHHQQAAPQAAGHAGRPGGWAEGQLHSASAGRSSSR
jgi:hypothetical protein